MSQSLDALSAVRWVAGNSGFACSALRIPSSTAARAILWHVDPATPKEEWKTDSLFMDYVTGSSTSSLSSCYTSLPTMSLECLHGAAWCPERIWCRMQHLFPFALKCSTFCCNIGPAGSELAVRAGCGLCSPEALDLGQALPGPPLSVFICYVVSRRGSES